MVGGTPYKYTRSWVSRPLCLITQQKLPEKGYMRTLCLPMKNLRLHEYCASLTLYSSCAISHTVSPEAPIHLYDSREERRLESGLRSVSATFSIACPTSHVPLYSCAGCVENVLQHIC